MLDLAGYIRVSAVAGREGEGYVSPAIQRDSIGSYASELGGRIAEWFTDEDQSGGTVERPAFIEALGLIEAGQLDGLVVMRVDRFARSVADGARIVRELVDADKVFAACHERIDPRTPEGRYMLTSFLNNAELFLEQTKAGWRVAKARAIERGVHIGPTPLGYRRVKSQPLGVDPVAGPVLSELFRRAAGGEHKGTELAAWVTDAIGSERVYQPSEVRRWLRSRVYLGEVRYGALVNAEAHPPLTDPETFEHCQRPAGQRKRSVAPFMLSGLVRCAACRYSMSGQTAKVRVYRCAGKGRCPAPSVIAAERLESYVIAEVRKAARGRLVRGVPTQSDLAAVESKLAEAEVEVQAFASDLEARRLLGDEGWREALAVRVAERDRLRAERGRIAAERNVAEVVKRADEVEGHDLRDLLVGSLWCVFVRRGRGVPVAERVRIVDASEPEPSVPGPHRPGPFPSFDW